MDQKASSFTYLDWARSSVIQKMGQLGECKWMKSCFTHYCWNVFWLWSTRTKEHTQVNWFNALCTCHASTKSSTAPHSRLVWCWFFLTLVFSYVQKMCILTLVRNNCPVLQSAWWGNIQSDTLHTYMTWNRWNRWVKGHFKYSSVSQFFMGHDLGGAASEKECVPGRTNIHFSWATILWCLSEHTDNSSTQWFKNLAGLENIRTSPINRTHNCQCSTLSSLGDFYVQVE